MAAGLVLAGYTFSVIWRVSLAERDLFGKSTLIPMAAHKSFEDGPVCAETFGSNSFWFERHGKRILVWKDKINCFQHCYGSALAAYELGEGPATWLFNANEYMDYIRDSNGIKENNILDRKKDLAHNIVGRQIGLSAKAHGLSGERLMPICELRFCFLWTAAKMSILAISTHGCGILAAKRLLVVRVCRSAIYLI